MFKKMIKYFWGKNIKYRERFLKNKKSNDLKDVEEVLEINAVINHIIINENPSFKDMAKLIPKYVAIPLPPLNLIHIG